MEDGRAGSSSVFIFQMVQQRVRRQVAVAVDGLCWMGRGQQADAAQQTARSDVHVRWLANGTPGKVSRRPGSLCCRPRDDRLPPPRRGPADASCGAVEVRVAGRVSRGCGRAAAPRRRVQRSPIEPGKEAPPARRRRSGLGLARQQRSLAPPVGTDTRCRLQAAERSTGACVYWCPGSIHQPRVPDGQRRHGDAADVGANAHCKHEACGSLAATASCRSPAAIGRFRPAQRGSRSLGWVTLTRTRTQAQALPCAVASAARGKRGCCYGSE